MAGHLKIYVFLGLCSIHAQIYAQSEKANQIFENINDTFRGKTQPKDHQFGEFFLLLIAGSVLIFVIWLAYQLFVQRKRNQSPDSAWGLYKKLCQVHNLSLKERFAIRKVCHWNELDDPLPLFVEPNYLKQVLADDTKPHFHGIIQELLDKLFSSEQELVEAAEGNIHENSCVNLVNQEAVYHVEHQVGNLAADSPAAHSEQSSVSSDQEKPLPPVTKVLLNPIPGRMAFSSLVEPLHRLSTEIAAESIRHNLSDGRGMNERTYDGVGELRKVAPEPQSPLFPKSNVPSPTEMLANESRKDTLSSPISPTPQYLRTHKETMPVVFGKSQNHPRHNRNTSQTKPGETASFETIVTGRLKTVLQ